MPHAWILLGLLFSLPAQADSTYQAGASICGTIQALSPPPAPSAACMSFQRTYAALASYARDAIAVCGQANAQAQAARSHVAKGCAGGGATCAGAASNADNAMGTSVNALQAVKSRNEGPVRSSFPAQGARISGACLTYLDAYQGFTYALTGGVDDAVRALNNGRSELQAVKK